MIDIIGIIQPIAIAAGTGAVCGYWQYKNQVADPTKPTPIRDDWKLASTAILGAGVGLGIYLSGVPVTDTNVIAQMAVYGILTVGIERGLKTAYRWIKWKHPEIITFFKEQEE